MFGSEPVEIERMTGTIGEEYEEDHLRPAVPFAEGMDCIEGRQKAGCVSGKVIG
jgi:hypothetical protein